MQFNRDRTDFSKRYGTNEYQVFPRGSSSKESAYDVEATGDTGLTLGLGISPGGGHGNPLQYSCLENPMDRGAWWDTAHRVTKSWTHLTQLCMHTQMSTNMETNQSPTLYHPRSMKHISVKSKTTKFLYSIIYEKTYGLEVGK